jgi:hypothetical protein
MKRSAVIFFSFFFLGSAPARSQDEKPFSLHDLLLAAKLPQGYQAKTQSLKADGKTLGDLIVVSKPNESSNIIIQIEFRELSQLPFRQAAAKAYANVFAAKIGKLGYKLVKKSIPDISKESFEKPVSIELIFEDSQGKKLWTHQEIFFTDKGFVASVTATDSDTLATLVVWTKTIKPKQEQGK